MRQEQVVKRPTTKPQQPIDVRTPLGRDLPW